MTVEFTEDGTNWFKFPTTNSTYKREVVDFDPKFNREDCLKLLKERFVGQNGRVEYSNDGGYSWTPLRTHYIEEDAARIYTMLQRNYKARILRIKYIGETTVTSGSFFRSVGVAEQTTQTKPVRHETTTMRVYRNQGGGYDFSPAGWDAIQGEDKTRIRILDVIRTTYFDMKTPNTNQEDMLEGGKIRNQAALRVRGFVYSFMRADNDPSINHWWSVLSNGGVTLGPDQFMVVRCARFYDTEMDQFFQGMGQPWGVLGGKFIVGWTNRTKLGDTWLVPRKFSQDIQNRIRSKGGFIVEDHKPQTGEVKFDPTNVDPRYIVQIKDSLQEIIKVGSDQQIADSLIQVVDFRNRCVDELKELNKVIEEARDKVKQSLVNG